MKKLIKFFKDEEGATAVEYSLMVAFIALVIISSVSFLGSNVSSKFNQFSTDLAAAS
ncbi:MAG: pilus assembly protein Flp/PilA [Desulfobacteraceae bacterium Eth-SRB2]|nr:MAG: pilus assembly protein Flp/PilA [Desulfobacteraceae bacterium Eth-SRB2]